MNDIKKLMERFKNLRILVLGDTMLDEHLWCNVTRISPEAPVPVAQIDRVTLMPGGAGNVANNIRSLGAKVDLIGAIGNDSTGKKLINILAEKDIGYKGIIREKNRATTLKSRVIAHSQHVVRVDRDDIKKLRKVQIKEILRNVEGSIKKYDAIILSDYAKGFLCDELTRNLIKIANKHETIISVDPKGICYKKYKNATFITPNKIELERAVGRPIENDKSLIKSAKSLKNNLNLKYMIVTHGEKGMIVIDQNNNVINLKTVAHNVYDITGAGDTVIAVLTLGISSGLSIIKSAEISNCAAGIVVEKVGTSVVYPDELSKLLSSK